MLWLMSFLYTSILFDKIYWQDTSGLGIACLCANALRLSPNVSRRNLIDVFTEYDIRRFTSSFHSQLFKQKVIQNTFLDNTWIYASNKPQ